MIIRLNKYLVVLLSFLLFSQNIYSQVNQPRSTNFKVEFSVFMSSCVQAESEKTSIFGMVGNVFNNSGSSQNFKLSNDVLFLGNLITDTEDLHNCLWHKLLCWPGR